MTQTSHSNALRTALQTTPKLLLILDGFGIREERHSNAIAGAQTPNFDQLWNQTARRRLIGASGLDVGLPDGQMGNSEVGHMNIGAGRILYQDLTKISKSIEDGSLQNNHCLTQGFGATLENGTLHVLGLLSPGGVHSHEDHILALVTMAKAKGLKQVFIHAFLDGRDTAPKSAQESLEKLEQHLQALQTPDQKFAIATVCGRFYAMDRDSRWERIQAAYDGIVHGRTKFQAGSALEALTKAYEREETDEFVQATQVAPEYQGVQDGDGILFANFRSDRAKQLSAALFTQEEKPFHFERGPLPKLSAAITLTAYSDSLPVQVAFPREVPKETLGETLAQFGLTQLRLAETEKYAHVTFFMNAGLDDPWKNEDRSLIPSPDVRTYDEAPSMSLDKVTDTLCSAIEKQQHDVIICNFANADMVGHTGDYEAAVKAIESIDKSLGRVIASLEKVNGEALVTADHGNAEQMQDPSTGQPHTAHTSEPVPLIYIGQRDLQWADIKDGRLADLAPTLLHLRGIRKPNLMTGRCLISSTENPVTAP